MIDPYDTWEKTDAAGICSRKAFDYLHDIKPDKKAPQAEKDWWDVLHREAVKVSVAIHERRIALNIKELNKWRSENVDALHRIGSVP